MTKQSNIKKRKAVIYARVSSERQVDNMSLGEQQRVCKAYCKRYFKDDVSEERIFVEKGESAKTANRTELQKMLKYCAQHKKEIGYVVVYKVDRFSRKVADFAALKAILAKMGIALRSVTEPIGEESNTSVLMENILACFAQFDNDMRGERAQTGMRAVANEGGWTMCAPVGYINWKNEAKKSTLKVDEEMRKPIQKFFTKFATGLYTQEEAVELAKKCGIRNKKGEPMSRTGIHKMLRAPVYAGWVCNKSTDGRMVVGLHEALIDKKDWYKIQDLLDGRTEEGLPTRSRLPKYHKNNSKFPLRRFFVCSICGKPLTGSTSKGHTTCVSYYHCHRCSVKNCGHRVSVQQEEAHRKFEELLAQIEPAPWVPAVFKEIVIRQWNNDFKDAIRDVEGANSRIAELEKKKSKLIDKYIEDKVSEEDYQRTLARYEQAKLSLEAERATLEENKITKESVLDTAMEFITNLVSTWRNLPLKEKQKFQIAIFPKKITVLPNGDFGTYEISPIFQETTEIERTLTDNKNGSPSGDATMAERTGFEPAKALRPYTLSKRAPSTTRTPLRLPIFYHEIPLLPIPYFFRT